MASLEIVKRAIAGGRVYDDLPPRIKNMITPNEWKTRVKEHCIQRGLPWATSLACTVMGQQEYYDDLLRCYKSWMRLFPYHLSDYLCRVARITPFKYYLDMMTSVLKEERSYDRVPNFTAADALSVLGIGRNEYISVLNACKARRLLWRVNLNRDSIVREHLPQEPTINTRLEPWWRVAVVNIGEAEYRELDEEELAHLKTAAVPVTAAGGDIRVRDFQLDVLRGLLRKGLAYVEVPVEPYDRFAIPPLEGFVSNKTTEVGDAAADPFESLLYSVFVANSERMMVAELGQILGVNLEELKAAIGVASRLGFATRVTDSYMPPSPGMPTSGTLEGEASSVGIGSGELYGRGSVGVVGDGGGDEAALQQQQQQRSLQLAEGLLGPAGRELRGTISGAVGGGGGVAVVVDAEATGYLMMGALSPGLKRHSVTLFEGGRVAGEEVMQEMVSELWSSYAAGQGFEGEMLRLTHYAAALATLLEAVRASAGPGVPLELLRKESLAGLSPMAVSKVLNHAYCAVVPISPLPPPVLPLSPLQPGPAYYGPTLEAVSPWLHLALYSAARCGPASYVFVCGQRVWRLPHPLDRCTHALLTPWDEDTEPGKSGRSHGTEGQMMLVESSFLLYTLNELLSRTAVLVQPLDCTEPEWCPDVVDVPLPLPAAESTAASASAAAAAASDRLTLHRISSTEPSSASTIASPSVVPGIRRTNGEPVKVVLEPGLVSGLRQLGLASCIGHLRLIRMRTPPPRPAAVAEQQLHPPASPAGTVGGSSVGGPHGVTVNGSRDGGGALQGQLLQWQGDGFPAADAGGGSGAMRTSGSITITAASQSRNRDAAVAAAATQGPGGPNASGPQPLVDSSGLPTPVPSPRPPAAPGGGGGVCGLDFDAAGAAVAVDDRGGDPWLPLSVQLGVPLYCLNLCRAVCRAAQAAGFLTPEGRQTQLQAHKVLQTQLTKLLVQYSHCAQDGSYGSATGLVAAAAAAVGEAAALSPDIRAALMASGGGGGGVDLGVGGGGCAGDSSSSIGSGGILGRMNPVLPLPALNLSFDGHSLQPIRLRDSVQGLGCLCQG